jgi:hypothetical protein
MGADGRKPSLVESYFWENSAETNVADEEAGRIAQNAYNLDIVTGYREALELNQDQKATFWRDIGDLVGDTSYLGDSKSWDDRAWDRLVRHCRRQVPRRASGVGHHAKRRCG